MSGGLVTQLAADDNSIVSMSGGEALFQISASVNGIIYLDGTGFAVDETPLVEGDKLSNYGALIENGDYDYYDGRITGTLADGTALDTQFRVYNAGQYAGTADIIIGTPPVPVCHYKLMYDLNNDCRADLADLALLSQVWLIDCSVDPGHAECIPLDIDGDGFNANLDCDDSNPNIYPDAEEIWYDGINQNCDDESDYDQDQDGFDSVSHGGTDCDDTNPTIYLGATEIANDGIDQDCDGFDLEVSSGGMVWSSIDEPGEFVGDMSKYEVTNAKYCQFLNDAFGSGDITVGLDDFVYGADGFNTGADFVGDVYYDLIGPGYTYSGATNGGAARISYDGGVFTVDDAGFEDHPVTYVSWYGATAYCNYYGYRLPTEWEWQAVADHTEADPYDYGCGTDIDSIIANYSDSTHPDGTAAVGDFGVYGYGLSDMAGNVWEWTSSVSGIYRIVRGGSWYNADYYCDVTHRSSYSPSGTAGTVGFRVCRDSAPIIPMTWVSIDDPGVDDDGDGTPDHEGFTGEMSKYETTNAQYCEFLNAALASGDAYVDGNYVKGSNGSNVGSDFVDETYCRLDGPGYTDNGATNGGAARINYSGGFFTVDNGFDNHPLTYVSWYGSTAFCNYYGYRLPTEWEWQAVADYDGTFTYGCGTSINNSIANYQGSTHPDGTTVVGSFGTHGYGMCDMAGNVWEWTSSFLDPTYDSRITCGGCWDFPFDYCTVSNWYYGYSDSTYNYLSFRVCR
ncbi:hypothetical protein LCGC14_1630320 [marine sediment metagenome]|uniref:Sulfatase-modifying factor enzyme-like domain-containing protein n=1 Tax=marine sediment metagenome TaxID=412755 RepID=A0A0F9I308_9ZZZZ